jgi:hypothetical protein
MNLEVHVAVTEEHIREGNVGSCSTCPIALAIIAKAPELQLVRVGAYRASATHEGRRVSAHLPEEARLLVRRFDGRSPVQPIQFWIRFEPVERNPND